MLSPVVSHVPCALDQQRRIQEATRDAVARSVRGRGWLFRLWPGRPSRRALGTLDASPRGEDVWASLRF